MIERSNPNARRDRFGSKINRDQSPLLAHGIPWLSILLASLVPLLPLITPAAMVPPLGFMMLLVWRLVRPGLLPPWVGVPLGGFDDLYSGQPFGCAIMLWSLALLAIEFVEARFPWRGFAQDWLVSSCLITAYLISCAVLSGGGISGHAIAAIIPQVLLSVALFPIIGRMVSTLDRFRLTRFRVII